MLKLTKLKDGRFVRNLGPSGGQQKFYLGRDERDALLRVAQLEKLWDWRRESCRMLEETPAWDDVSSAVGKSIASGDRVVVLDIDAPPELAVGIISEIRDAVPQLEIRLSNQQAQQGGEEFFRAEAEKHADLAKRFTLREGNQTLAEAIDAYIESLKENEEYKLEGGLLTEWGQGKIRQIEFVSQHTPANQLGDFDNEQIDKIIGFFASRRPQSRHKKPISRSYAKALIKEFRQFIRWLHSSKDFHWRKPDDYEVRSQRIKVNEDERDFLTPFVEVYSTAELATLWLYATPWERCLMILALNCGFGMAEIGTLRKNEIFLEQPHQFGEVLGIEGKDDASWIRRVRAKTNCYGDWILWDETVTAINWINEHRPNSDLPYVVVTQNGRPLKEDGKRNSRIANIWASLTKRIQQDDSEFEKRSFNKLRKTSSNSIRRKCGDDIAELFLSHGSPLSNHQHLGNYTNPRLAVLHEGIEWYRESLQSVFSKVTEPFPEREKKGGANISLGRIQMIHELHDKGMPIDLIAKKVNVSKETVRRRLAHS